MLRLIRDGRARTHAELVELTGLSRSTVSSIVGELLSDGLVSERDVPLDGPASRGGRPPTTIALDPAAGVAVGIDFGKRHLSVAASDLGHAVLAETRRDMEEDYTAADGMQQAEELVGAVLDDAGVDRADVIGVGMGLPGPVHRPTGLVGSATILPGWAGVHLHEEMQDLLALPVHVDNDANLGALAEAAFGAARDASDMIYLKVSSGIGAGLILNGRLYRGSFGLAGELGHLLVDPDGIVCRCGNRGCLETLAATGALVELLRRSHGEDVTAAGMLELARAGDLGCRRVIADAGRAIGNAVSTLLNVLNPELVVVGGDLAAAGDLLLDGVRESIARAALPAAAEAAGVVAGVLGERAQVLGAIALVVSEADRAFPTRLAEA
jgi:predicted NBD/HSP70 family sugar kinase